MTHKYGSDVPRARGELTLIADSLRAKGDAHHANWLESMMHLLHRKPVVRKTPVRNPPPSRAQRIRVLRLARATDLSQQAIAEVVGLNAGRVSEILNGN